MSSKATKKEIEGYENKNEGYEKEIEGCENKNEGYEKEIEGYEERRGVRRVWRVTHQRGSAGERALLLPV